ncbi:hypothetical protein [Streptomyces sp. NPDC056982]|uniref:hypothetical protein n=1 Tax=Streptomyces sp. NPDC056982 TaxID=3345986 RepID=UPI00363F79E2
MPEHVNPEAAVELVREVISWYAQQVIRERRAASPDAKRLEAMKAQLVECAADERALQVASEEEVAEIAARYAALSRELKGG